MQEIRKSEVRTDVSVDSKHQTLSGVLFPIAQEIKDSLSHLCSGKIDYIQMKIGESMEKFLMFMIKIVFYNDFRH